HLLEGIPRPLHYLFDVGLLKEVKAGSDHILEYWVPFSIGLILEKDAFPQIPGADTGRIKLLYLLENRFNQFGGIPRNSRKFIDRISKIAVIINTLYNPLGYEALFMIQFTETGLQPQMIPQIRRPLHHVLIIGALP